MSALQITLRLIHVFTGIFWAGTVFFLLRFLLPALGATGTSGQKVMQDLVAKRKVGVAIPIAAVLAVLSGFSMYYLNIRGSSGAWAQSPSARVYGIGGLCGLIAMIIGATMIGPSLEKIVKIQLAAEAASRAPTADETATLGRLRARSGLGMKLAATLLVITVAGMAIGRYVF